MNDIGMALIGCGGLGRVHAQCVSRIDGARFLAYVDINAEAARKCLDEFGGEYATTDVHKALRDDRVDVVYIVTRHD